MTHINIIGGGATGAAVLIALLKQYKESQLTHPIHITIFEPKANLGLGLAYSVPLADLRLNTSVGSTSIDAHDEAHFINWLKQNESLWRPLFPDITTYNQESFLPRALCGLYIHETLKNEISLTNKNLVKITHIQEKVTDIRLNSYKIDSFVVFTAMASYPCDACILATGYGQGYSSTYPYLSENKHYYSSPYLCIDEIKNIPLDANVLIIGTGLTAIDASLILKKHHHVTLTSRRGFIPAVRNRLCLTEPMHLTKEFQTQFFNHNKHSVTIEKLRKEIEIELSLRHKHIITFDDVKIAPDSIRQLREDIHFAKKKKNHWEDSMMCILFFIDKAWRYLSSEDKNEFIAKEMKFISRYISSFPLENAKILYEKITTGSLLIKENLSNIYIDGSRFRVEFIQKNIKRDERYDFVVNATSADKYITMLPGLYLNLIEHGIIKRNVFGGIKVSKSCRILTSAKKKHALFAAGPITKGSFLITNLLTSSAKQAQVIAERILNHTL